jgi:TonB-dependent SusC/RagA subfamily outer membrane receptor
MSFLVFLFIQEAIAHKIVINGIIENRYIVERIPEVKVVDHISLRTQNISGTITDINGGFRIYMVPEYSSNKLIDVTVTGVIKDSNGLPIPGVTISVQGANLGTISDIDGKYSITIPEGSTLMFSFIGFENKMVLVGNQQVIDIVLEESTRALDEVVVIGYGVQKKSDLTGSIVSLTEENFTQGPNYNALQLLAGRAAGVNISQANSAPGSGTRIQIRGAGSINADNSVLIVVDGLPGIDPRDLSPDDIASIEVLKDASAAAIYGTRAANGVVLITTKTGTKGDPVLRYNNYYGLQSVSNRIDVLNGRQYMETLNAIRIEGGQSPIYSQEEINQVGVGTD